MMQLSDVVGRDAASHWLDALAVAGRKKPPQVQRRPLTTDLVLEGLEDRLNPPIELLLVRLSPRDRARHAAQWSNALADGKKNLSE